MADVSQRLFLGSLHSGVTTNDVQELFSKFGKVSDAVISVKRDSTGGIYKSFAHVTISGQQENIDKAIKVLNNTRWKQARISIEKAKESFLEKLKREREEAKKLENAKAPADDAYQIDEHSEMRKFMKGTPGTKIPSKQDWVIGKFGRMLPVVNLEKNRKIVEIDPSQYTHTLKKLDNPKHESEHSAAKPIESLTWRLPEVDSDISRRRQGQFPEYHPPKKRRRRLPTPPPVDSLNIEVVKSAGMPPRQNIIEVEVANPGCRVYNSDSDNEMDTSTQNDNILGIRTHQLSTLVTPVNPGCRVYESDSEDGMSVDKATQPLFNGKQKESPPKGSRPAKKRKKKRGKADKSLITGVGKTPITNGNAESMSDIASGEEEATPTSSESVQLDKVVQTKKKTKKKTKSEKLKNSENNSSVKLKVTNNKSDSMSDIISDIEETNAMDLGAGASNNDRTVMPNGAQGSVMQNVIHKRTRDASEESDQQSDYDPTDFFSSPTVQNTPRLSEQNPFEHEEEAGTVDYQFDSIPKQWDYTTHDFKTGQTNALTLTRSEYWKKLKELKAKLKAEEDDDETNVEQLQKAESLETDAFDQEASVDSSDEEQGSDAEYQSFMEASDVEEEIDGPEFKSEEETSASEAADSDDVLQDGDDDSEEDVTNSDDSDQADDVDKVDVGVTVDSNSDDQQDENSESETSEQEVDEEKDAAGMMANSGSALIESDESDISDLEQDDESEVNDEQLISDEEELSDEVDVKSENIGTEPCRKYIYDPRLQEGVISDKESDDECSSDLNDSSVKNEVSDVESVDNSEVEDSEVEDSEVEDSEVGDSDDEDSSDREGFVGTYGQGDSDDTTSESAEGNQDSDDASSESAEGNHGDDSEQESDDASGESIKLNQGDDFAMDSDDASGESISLNLDDSALASDDTSGESVTLNHVDDSAQESDDASGDGKSDLDTSEVESPESEQQLDSYCESSPSDGSVTLGSDTGEDSDSDEDQENGNSEVMESENDADVESNSEDDEMMQQSDDVDSESHDEDTPASDEELQSDSASDEKVHSDFASDDEVQSDSASNEELQSDSASNEEAQSDSASNAENQECDENGVSDSEESDYGNMKAQAILAKEKKGDLKFTIVKNDASMNQSEPLVPANQSTSRPVNQSKTDDYYSSDDGEDLLDLLKTGADQKMHNYLTTQLKGKQLNEYKKQTAKVLAAEANRNLKNKQDTDLTKKQKIEKIQQKIGGDSRFKVNEKFLEKDRGTITKVAVGDLDSDEELEQERSKTLDIIENITGKSVSREKKIRNTFQSTAQQRYDPTKKGHGKLEVKVTKKTKKKKKHEEPAPVVAKEQFYNVESTALKNIFSLKTDSNNSGAFSFTSAIDPSMEHGAEHTTEAVQSPSEAEPMCTESTDHVQDEESGAEESPDDVVMKPADSRFALSALFKDDHKPADSGTAADEEEHNYPEDRFPGVDPEMYSSSEGEGESDEEESDQSEVATDKKLDDRLDFNAMVKPVSFFIRDGDPRIKAGFEFFKSTQTKEKIESVWLSRKDILAKSYEKQAKSSEHSKPKGVGVAQSSLRKTMPFFK